MNVQEELNKVFRLYLDQISELKGKTIDKVSDNWNYLAIRFTDGTYIGFQAENGDSDGDANIYICKPTVDDLREVGVISEVVYKAWLAEQDEKKKDCRRREWERLNKEFAPKTEI